MVANSNEDKTMRFAGSVRPAAASSVSRELRPNFTRRRRSAAVSASASRADFRSWPSVIDHELNRETLISRPPTPPWGRLSVKSKAKN